MKPLIMNYPGDPPCKVLFLTRAEFLHLHPRTPIVISGLYGENRQEIPMAPDEIHCDFCNNDPGLIVILVDNQRAYCLKCTQEHIVPYCKETK